MKYEVGETVLVHPDLKKFDKHEPPTINSYMLKMAGKEVVIRAVSPTGNYHAGDWVWKEKWLLPFKETTVTNDELMSMFEGS